MAFPFSNTEGGEKMRGVESKNTVRRVFFMSELGKVEIDPVVHAL